MTTKPDVKHRLFSISIKTTENDFSVTEEKYVVAASFNVVAAWAALTHPEWEVTSLMDMEEVEAQLVDKKDYERAVTVIGEWTPGAVMVKVEHKPEDEGDGYRQR